MVKIRYNYKICFDSSLSIASEIFIILAVLANISALKARSSLHRPLKF
jgi:hypothetical protein